MLGIIIITLYTTDAQQTSTKLRKSLCFTFKSKADIPTTLKIPLFLSSISSAGPEWIISVYISRFHAT